MVTNVIIQLRKKKKKHKYTGTKEGWNLSNLIKLLNSTIF